MRTRSIICCKERSWVKHHLKFDAAVSPRIFFEDLVVWSWRFVPEAFFSCSLQKNQGLHLPEDELSEGLAMLLRAHHGP